MGRIGTTIATAMVFWIGTSPTVAMRMELDGDQVLLEGDVIPSDPGNLRQVIQQNRAVLTTVIVRNSNGGYADSGYRIGEMIREAGLRTALSGHCLSACSRIFLGGRQRHFSDDQRTGLNRVGFHGNYASTGELIQSAVPRLRQWIDLHSDGKADPALVARWTTIPNRNGFAYFFDSTRLQRADGISAFLCSGTEPRENRYEHCEKLPGVNGYDLGIFTSPELVRVNEALRLKPQSQ